MTRFEQELAGLRGEFWKKDAERKISQMQERVDHDEIRTNTQGGAFWLSSGNYLPEDVAEVLTYTDFEFSIEETRRARQAQTEAFLERYRKNHRTSDEERAEIRAAFGPKATVVDIITGERI